MRNRMYGGVRGRKVSLKLTFLLLDYISFERMSKYNLIRGEAFISGECVSVIEDSGFTNVEQVITILLSSLPDNIECPTKVQIRITNLDKKQVRLYQRLLE